MQVARRDRYATSTLVIHNVNPSESILITGVRYYDHSGTQLKDYIDGPLSFGPFASASFVVDIGDDRGGVGANFIVEWQANETVVSPIAEAIMSGGMGTQSIQRRVFRDRPRNTANLELNPWSSRETSQAAGTASWSGSATR